MNPKAKALKQNTPISTKDRSREHRKRKREYYGGLEEKIQKLEATIDLLKEENNCLKKMKTNGVKETTTDDNSLKGMSNSLQRQQDYLYNNLGNKLIINPEEVRFSMIQQEVENTLESFEQRIQIIKKSFSLVLDNIASLDTKSKLL